MGDDPLPGINDSLAAARAGSREALGQALEAYRRYLLLVAGQELDPELKRKGGASDIVQQTFLEAQRDFPGFAGQTEAEFKVWLKRILLNNLANFQRHYKQTAKRDVHREVTATPAQSSLDWRQMLVADTVSPSGQAMAHEQSVAIAEALARLPEDYRRVIELRYSTGRTFEEIAVILDRTEAATRKLWARAVRRLKSELGVADEPGS